MAVMTHGRGTVAISVEWQSAPGVVTAELAATWCALEIRVSDRPVTLVEDGSGGGLRRWLHTSAYPLAEWIAQHWWMLSEHVRPSATAVDSWRWGGNRAQPWLADHNLRAVGNGLVWPDLTLVPEGAVTRLVWRPEGRTDHHPVSFLTEGDEYVPSSAVKAALGTFVDLVLDRLREAGVRDTPLQREWSALASLSSEEQQFAAAAARLGLDPFNVAEELASVIVEAAERLDADLLGEFLDCVDPTRIPAGTAWLGRVQRSPLPVKRRPPLDAHLSPADWLRPWQRGYEAAAAYRAQLDIAPTERMDVDDLVGLRRVTGDSVGLPGYVAVDAQGVGLALPSDVKGTNASRFAQARALGISLLSTRANALLDPAGTELSKQSRAFAAELLAPAEGIAEYLSVFTVISDRALEAVADRYGTSPVVVQRQYKNQVATAS